MCFFHMKEGIVQKTISNLEFRRSFGEFLDQVRKTKRPICITQHGVPWVMLKHPRDLDSDAPESEPALHVRLKLSAHLNSVHYQHKSLVITRRSTAVACLCPVESETETDPAPG